MLKLLVATAVVLMVMFACRSENLLKADTFSDPVVVSQTEDGKGMGYPDGRKLARDSQGNLYVAFRKKFRAGSSLLYHIFVAKSGNGGASWHILNDGEPIETTGDYTQRVPAIAVDSQDVIHLVWYGLDEAQAGGNEREIKYSRSADGGVSWTAWRNLADVVGYNGETLWQEHPLLHVGADNTLYVVWQGRDATTVKSQTRFSRSDDGGNSWSDWVDIHPSNGQNYSRPSLVAANDGTVTLLAYTGAGTDQRLVWARSPDGGETWGNWQPVSSGTADQRHLSLVLDGQDRVHAVWRQPAEGSSAPTQIHYAVLDGGGWSVPVVVSPSTAYQFFPSLGLAANGQLWLTWLDTADESGFVTNLHQEDPVGDVMVALLAENGRFHPPQQLTASGNAQFPSVGWGHHHQDNRFGLVWSEASGSGFDILYYQLPCNVPEAPALSLARLANRLRFFWSGSSQQSYAVWQAATVEFAHGLLVGQTRGTEMETAVPAATTFYRLQAVSPCGETAVSANLVGHFTFPLFR